VLVEEIKEDVRYIVCNFWWCLCVSDEDSGKISNLLHQKRQLHSERKCYMLQVLSASPLKYNNTIDYM
jgi:hypothetical protein